VRGRGRRGRILGIAGQDFPAGALLVVEAERGRQIVEAGFALVGGVAVLALPEEPCATTRPAMAARSLRWAASPSCLRMASKLSSVIGFGGVIITAW
jgi:hypothetical protein